jgi:BolA family transcriptional regulator, general stress-responsive regulator
VGDGHTIQGCIEQKLGAGISGLLHLDVINESDRHNVPPGSETHFKVVLVADVFDKMKLLERHRLVNALLTDELAGPVHALAIHAFTRAEWESRMGDAPMSPPCLGGGRTH